MKENLKEVKLDKEKSRGEKIMKKKKYIWKCQEEGLVSLGFIVYQPMLVI